MISLQKITSEEILFGLDQTERIVAVEPDTQNGAWIYRRYLEGVRRKLVPYRPWMLLSSKPDMELPGVTYSELEGDGFAILAEFQSHALYQEARFRIRDEHIQNICYPGGAKMAMLRSGQTLYKGMAFEEIVRLQFDIETNGLDPTPESNRILLIALSDNRGLLEIIEGDEPEILTQFVERIIERDPDVLEGHNVFRFDLPFIISRAQRHGIRLEIGRDGSEPKAGQERNFAIGGNTRPFVPIYIHGRQVIDTYLVVQRFDWAKGALSSYGLKECARQFGFAQQDRIELPRSEMAKLYREQREVVCEYARQDVIETAKLAELVTPIEFYQTQMVPDNYGQVAVTGSGEKINSLLIRAYLAAGRAIPLPRSQRGVAGGYTELCATGVLERVVKADFESLYPSLMLTHKISPASDTLGIFLPALKDLTTRRIEAKRRAGEAKISEDRKESNADSHEYWDGMQNSFKVLINSFYGYLGGPFCFNDPDAAERITFEGRKLVQEIAGNMGDSGSKLIEIDTDGIYFVPPETVVDESAEREYIVKMGASLPEGIRLAFDGRFSKMISLKTKNYVLLTYEDRKIFKGASLRSRADERFGRKFLEQAVDHLLNYDRDAVAKLYAETIEALLSRKVPITELARRERITTKTSGSSQKRRAAAISAGIPLGDHMLVYEKNDGSLGLLENYAEDENPRYYMDKLYKFARRLEEAFGGDFDKLIPKPTAQGLPHKFQTSLDFF